MLAHVFDQSHALRALQPADHNGCASTLLFNAPGRLTLRVALNLDTLSLPEPADNSIGNQSDACCGMQQYPE
jgi:hypothetical protein